MHSHVNETIFLKWPENLPVIFFALTRGYLRSRRREGQVTSIHRKLDRQEQMSS